MDHIPEFYSTFFLMFSSSLIFVCLGMFSTLKLFPLDSIVVIKNMVYTAQLVFHYLLITLLIFMWFNFQLSDAVHGKFVSLGDELETFKSVKIHHHVSLDHFYVFLVDALDW